MAIEVLELVLEPLLHFNCDSGPMKMMLSRSNQRIEVYLDDTLLIWLPWTWGWWWWNVISENGECRSQSVRGYWPCVVEAVPSTVDHSVKKEGVDEATGGNKGRLRTNVKSGGGGGKLCPFSPHIAEAAPCKLISEEEGGEEEWGGEPRGQRGMDWRRGNRSRIVGGPYLDIDLGAVEAFTERNCSSLILTSSIAAILFRSFHLYLMFFLLLSLLYHQAFSFVFHSYALVTTISLTHIYRVALN